MANPVTMDDIESLIGRLVSAQISAVQASTVAGGSTREATSLNALQVAVKLDGPATYLTWARSTLLLVQGRGLDRYLTGVVKKPTSGESGVTQWEMENSVVLAFLLNTMELNIARSVQLLRTAHEVWEAVAQMYSQCRNSAQEFEIRAQLRELCQGEMTVTEYATELKRLWSEADHYRTFVPTSTADVEGFQKYLERERVQDFLYGLNSEFESVRVQLLARDDLPTIGQAFSTVLSEETRRRVSSTVSVPVRSALIVQPQTQPSGEKICHHCNKLGHIKAQCWELHGRPTQFGRGGRGRSGNGGRRGGGHGGGRGRGRTFRQAHLSEETDDSKSGLSAEEYQLLRRMLEKHEVHSGAISSALEAPSKHDEYIDSSHFAQSGTPSFIDHALSCSDKKINSWVIDSGASSHMTGISTSFRSYSPCSGRDKVRLADGSFASVSGKGSVDCTPTLRLSSVLHVPSFPTNLLSISSITRELNCSATFWPSHCLFQELNTGKTIGCGKMHNGLYYLDTGGQSFDSTPERRAFTVDDASSEMILHHRSLYARKPMDMQKNTITAQNRKDPNQNTGISIHACRVLPAADLAAAAANAGAGYQTYLGRPWKLFSRTVYMMSYIAGHVHPAGWLEWNATFALDTLYYGEYMNYGPGAAVGKRVAWPGYRIITLPDEASKFTVAQFIYGSSWLPSTGVAFLAGLSV